MENGGEERGGGGGGRRGEVAEQIFSMQIDCSVKKKEEAPYEQSEIEDAQEEDDAWMDGWKDELNVYKDCLNGGLKYNQCVCSHCYPIVGYFPSVFSRKDFCMCVLACETRKHQTLRVWIGNSSQSEQEVGALWEVRLLWQA